MTQKEKVEGAIGLRKALEAEAIDAGYKVEFNLYAHTTEAVLLKYYASTPRGQGLSERHNGVAVCSKGDEKFYDPQIGYCIALHKALRTPVPEWLIAVPKEDEKQLWRFSKAKYIHDKLMKSGGSATEAQISSWISFAEEKDGTSIDHPPVVAKEWYERVEPISVQKTRGYSPSNPCCDKDCKFCHPKG